MNAGTDSRPTPKGGFVIPNFEALGLIAEVALGIVGFTAVLIGLNRSTDRFSEPDQIPTLVSLPITRFIASGSRKSLTWTQ